MANVQLIVDDTSPEIAYTPFGDTFSTPNPLAGWNPSFSLSGFAAFQGQIGNGTSFHTTSLDGAILSLQWHGTNIQLIGNASEANYTITLDGATQPNTSVVDNVLASFTDLPDADHTLSLTTHISTTTSNNPYIAFDKAVISLPVPTQTPDESSSFQSISEGDVSYIGQWSFEQNGPETSFHQSTTAGDRATTMFQGIAFNLSGTTSPSSGTYSVTLKPTSNSSTITKTLSARSSFTQQNTLLFFADGLNQSEPYSVEVRNIDGGMLALDVGGFAVLGLVSASPTPQPIIPTPTVDTSTSSSFPAGTIAALALSGILLFFLVSLALFYIILWRPRTRRVRLRRRTSKPKSRESGEIVIIEQPKTSTELENGVARVVIPSGAGDDVSEGHAGRDVEAPSSGVLKAKRKAGSRKSNSGPRPSRGLSTISSIVQHLNPNRDTSERDVNIPGTSTSPVTAHDTNAQRRLSPPSFVSDSLHICPDCETIESTANTDANETFTTPSGHEPPRRSRIAPTVATDASDDPSLEYVDDNYNVEGQSEVDGSGGGGAVAEAEQKLESPRALIGEGQPFLKVRESSPFRVDFPRHSLKSARASGSGPSKTRLSGMSRVRFRDDSAEDLGKSKEGDDVDGTRASLPPIPPIPHTTFQLTPPSTGQPAGRATITSFLDLTGSPSGSVRTHSSSSSSRRPRLPERSRWSTTTSQSVPTDRSIAGNISQGEESRLPSPISPSRLFPFRFSLLAPHIHRHNPPIQNEPSGSRPQTGPQVSEPLQIPERGLHPLSDVASSPSPTHSVPTTISDLHFRNSESDDASRTGFQHASSGSRLPPHPPLPGGFVEPRRHQRERSSLSHVSSLLTNQPNIVQRVLGLQSQGANRGAAGVARSSSGSGSVSPNILIPKRFRPS